MNVANATYSDTTDEVTYQELKAVMATRGHYRKLNAFEQRLTDETKAPDYAPHRYDLDRVDSNGFDSFKEAIGLNVRHLDQS